MGASAPRALRAMMSPMFFPSPDSVDRLHSALLSDVQPGDLPDPGRVFALVYVGGQGQVGISWEAISYLRGLVRGTVADGPGGKSTGEQLVVAGWDLPAATSAAVESAVGDRVRVIPLEALPASLGAVPLVCGANRARVAAAVLAAHGGDSMTLVPRGIDLTREAVMYELALLYDLTTVLRVECPWDRDQTQASIVRYTLEETYELVDAVARGTADGEDGATADDGDVMGELGDLLFQVYFLAVVAQQEERYDLGHVAAGIRRKLVRRHPHIFGDTDAPTADDVKRNWDQIKRHTEGRVGIFHEVPDALASPLLAQKLQARAAEVGFDWPDAGGPLLKVDEELQELRSELARGTAAAPPAGGVDGVAAELGDLLFAVVNVARKLKVDPELALRAAAGRFRARVEAAAELAEGEGHVWSSLDLDEQEQYYQRAKADLAARRNH